MLGVSISDSVIIGVGAVVTKDVKPLCYCWWCSCKTHQ